MSSDYSNYNRTIEADVNDLRADAEDVWEPARDALASVKAQLPNTLPASAFSNIPGADGVYRELNAACEAIIGYLEEGETAMLAFRNALLWAALDVIGTEESVQDDIAAIQAQLEES